MLDQLREITGVQDAELLSRALMDSRAAGGNYDVARAVALLVDGCQTAEQPAEPAAPRPAPPAAKVGVGRPLTDTAAHRQPGSGDDCHLCDVRTTFQNYFHALFSLKIFSTSMCSHFRSCPLS